MVKLQKTSLKKRLTCCSLITLCISDLSMVIRLMIFFPDVENGFADGKLDFFCSNCHDQTVTTVLNSRNGNL